MPSAMHVWALACTHQGYQGHTCGMHGRERKTRWRATLTICSVVHCCTCHNTGHSSAKCDEAREHTQARLSDADRHACVGPCMHTSRLPQPCVWDAWERKTRWRATLTSCSVGHCCTCHNTGHSRAKCDDARKHTQSPCTTCVCWHLAYVHAVGAAMVGFGEQGCACVRVCAAGCTWLNAHAYA